MQPGVTYGKLATFVQMKEPYIIGITGGSGSGKTYLLKCLLDAFKEGQICLVSQDNYYKSRDLQPVDEAGFHNFDTPSSIHYEDYLRDILTLKAGKSVQRIEYTFNNPDVSPQLLSFKPAPIIVLEGIFVFYDPNLLPLIDLKVFIDAHEHVKLKRRIIRDSIERGYDLEDVLYRYEKHVSPAYEKFIKPYKSEADIVIPNNDGFEKGLAVLVAFLKEQLKREGQ